MTTTPLSTVIGVFSDHDQANGAIDELRHAKFGYDRIRLVERGTGGFVDTLKGMFTGQTSMASSTPDSLVKMGLPEYEAQYYQRELDANHVLLLMNADDRPEDAFDIMRQSGAFDINARLRTTALDSSDEMSGPVQQDATTTPYPDGTPVAYNPVQQDATTAPYTDGTPVAYNPAQQDAMVASYPDGTADMSDSPVPPAAASRNS